MEELIRIGWRNLKESLIVENIDREEIEIG